MIALLALALRLQAAAPVEGVVRDGATGAALPVAAVAAPRARARTDEQGRFTIAARPGDTLRITRIGYRPARAVVDGERMDVSLAPVALQLEAVAVREAGDAARLGAAREVARSRADGATTVGDAVSALPFVGARGGRAGLALSMRGSRAEQVLVVLDGVPLNDPSTGSADLTDVPLAAIGALAAAPGADAARWGSGASGGVLTLSSGRGTLVSAGGGSFGMRTVEARSALAAGAWQLHGGAGYHDSRNDFEVVLDRTRQGLPDSSFRRADADERRLSLFGGAAHERASAMLLASSVARGLPRPVGANSAALREDRRRLLARVQADVAGWSLAGGARILALDYRDPAGVVSATHADSRSLDVDAVRDFGALTLRAGAGSDRVSATRLATTDRPRAFAALEAAREVRAVRLDAALRADAVRDAGTHLSPSLGASWRGGALALHARASQGFRVPSFYDLYIASAVAAEARAVRPERVTLDAEAGLRLGGDGAALSGAVFVRRTRDAIVWLPGSFSWSPRNVEHETVTGAETRLVAAAGVFSAEAWAGAYRTRALIDGYDVPTPYAAQAAGGATVRAAHRAFELSTSLAALGRRQYVTAPASRALELPGVATVDLTLSHRARLRSARLLSVAGVRNLGDVRWEPVRRFPSPGRNWILGLTITS